MVNDTSSTRDQSLAKMSFAERYHSPVIAWIILAISLVLTASAYTVSRQLVEKRLSDNFDFRSNEISRAIQDRLNIYEQILWSGVALFDASTKEVEREQWRKFVYTLHIDAHWPGIQGIGYSIPVNPNDKQQHINKIQQEGFVDYKIRPEGERDSYSAIVYLEPFDWRNKRAFGYDMWSNEMRRAAMSRARDTGVAATSGIITLVQETNDDVQRGFLTYVPVYKSPPQETTASRRELFLGWVYAPFRAGNLMAGILGSGDKDIIFDIYDGTNLNEDNLLYSSVQHEQNLEGIENTSLFNSRQTIELQGRTWSLIFRTPTSFAAAQESQLPRFVAIIGLIIDILLFYVILSMYYINRRAKRIAEGMTTELRETKDSLEKTVAERTQEISKMRDELEVNVMERTNELRTKISELEEMNQITTGREIRVIELKQEVNALSRKLDQTQPYDNEQTDK